VRGVHGSDQRAASWTGGLARRAGARAPLALLALLSALVALTATAAPASAATSGSLSGSKLLAPISASEIVDTAQPGRPLGESLIGFNGPTSTGSSRLEALHSAWVRFSADLSARSGGKPVFDCTTGKLVTAIVDHDVALVREEGARPLLDVMGTPPCLASLPKTNPLASVSPPDLGSDRAKWVELVKALAERAIQAEGVRTFEIWDAPDLPSRWTGTEGQYLQLYEVTARAIESVAAKDKVRVQIGGPALGDREGRLDAAWLERFLAFVAAHDLPLGFVSWHLFANDPYVGPAPDGSPPVCPAHLPASVRAPCWYNPGLTTAAFGASVREVASLVRRFPTLHPVLWIDKWNLDRAWDPRMDSPAEAAFVTSSLASMFDARLGRAAFSAIQDGPSELDDGGVLTRAGLPKPAYDAFLFWSELRGSRLPALLSTTRASVDGVRVQLGSVASRARDGVVHVLLWNFVPYDPTGGDGSVDPNRFDAVVHVALDTLAHRRYGVTLSLIDAKRLGGVLRKRTLQASHPEATVDLPGDGVAMLTLTPQAVAHDGFPIGLSVGVGSALVVALGLFLILRRR
jgi:hypothetical protein